MELPAAETAAPEVGIARRWGARRKRKGNKKNLPASVAEPIQQFYPVPIWPQPIGYYVMPAWEDPWDPGPHWSGSSYNPPEKLPPGFKQFLNKPYLFPPRWGSKEKELEDARRIKLNFYTYGVHDDYMRNSVAALNFDIYSDARVSSQQPTEPWHSGENFEALKATYKSETLWDLYELVRKDIKYLKREKKTATEANILVFCETGRFYSVTYAVLFHHMFQNRGYETSHWPVHLSRPSWPADTCVDCDQCRRDVFHKAKADWLASIGFYKRELEDLERKSSRKANKTWSHCKNT